MTKEPPHISSETVTEVLPHYRRESYRKDKAARAHAQSDAVREAKAAGRAEGGGRKFGAE